MEMKPGYKQTEVGQIPEEWEVQQLGVCLAKRPSYGINAPAVPYSDRLPVYIRITDITDEGRFFSAERVSVRSEMSSNYYLEDGDIVFARTGASVGKSYRYNRDDGPLVYAGFLIRVRPNAEKLLPAFASAYVTTGPYWRWVRKVSMRSGQPGINGNEYAQLPIPLPPPPEQRAIATALGDVDALLGGLDRLIAKERDLKQAVMQQLLTGQTRLPGFHGEWDVASLDMLTSRATGVWGQTEPDERNSLLAEVIRAGDITQDGRLTATASRYLAPEEFERAKCVLDDLVITTSGNGLGKLWWCDGRSNIAASNFVRVLHPKAAMVIGRFLYYALRTAEGLRQLEEHTATSAYPNLRPTYFSTAWIPLPPPPEQVAIAAVLSDMDAELAALQARRDKTRDLKQAMMQELLTGKTRLVPAGARDA
jgi:type I restriction enzyme S subunit